MPGENDLVVVSDDILLDVHARVAGVIIQPGGHLAFDARRSILLESSENIVVQGRLTMTPETQRIVHRMIFVDIDETDFVGGGMEVLPSDVGLWVMDNGVLDITGSRRLAWTRASQEVSAGATTVHLQEDPVGWRIGDEIVLTPTLSPATPDHDLAYDYATVASINGRTIKLSQPTTFAHPVVAPGRGIALGPEVLNLTRNVCIEGTAGGRAHIFIHSAQRQKIRNASVRYMGPRRPGDEYTVGIPGRYGLHFHMCDDGSRGSIVNGIVIRDCGNHAFVPHQSHGVTFRRCISHNTFDDPYWYDQRPDGQYSVAPPTNDALYETCVASLVKHDPPFRGFSMGGFVLGADVGNRAIGCVAVGVQGTDSAGFVWPESSVGTWVFEDCVAHNNKSHGIFVWQNNGLPHPITRFVAYHNGGTGIFHGAYLNGYKYKDSILYANALSAVELHALSRPDLRLTFQNVLFDQAGLTGYCVVTKRHNLPADAPVLFDGCHFRGHTHAALGFFTDEASEPESFDVIDCTFEGNEFWLAPTIRPESVIQIRDTVHGDIQLRRFDQAGEPRPEWNASVTA